MKKALFLFPLISLLFTGMFGQDRGAAPFPTELEVTPRETGIFLSWKDTASLDGEVYHIHRHYLPITNNNLSEAKLIGTVSEGTGQFTDHPPGGTPWYYLVTAEDSRFHYPVIIPYGNSSVRGVSISTESISRAQAVKISRLSARTSRDSVIITFNRDKEDRSVSVYRSTSPITSMNQLEKAYLLAVLEKDQHTWKDNPIPGIPYYYAAVDRDLLSLGIAGEILYEGNYTVYPAEIPLSEFLDNPNLAMSVRKAPLPTLQLERYFTDIPRLDIEFPEYIELNPKLKRNLASFLTMEEEANHTLPEPAILAVDREAGGNALEVKLRKILGEYFLKDRWPLAERALLFMLSEMNDEDLTSRIHYYRGQCFYFQENYEMAYLEFLLSRDSYYTESETWMEKCLDQLL